jgi:hypothetical protein
MVPRGQRENPYGRILGFLDRNRYFFFQIFQTHHFSEYLVAPGIELRPLDL